MAVYINITCPGVWLCSSGKVALRIITLGSSLESHRVSPIFPLLFHDRFTFKNIFTRLAALTELQLRLEQESLHAELIQWIGPCSQPVVLATFDTNLADLLYPVSCYKGLLPGVDVDLLMEPTKYFPGIIVPKIEVSTKTIIEDVQGVQDTNVDRPYIVNPKTINSKNTSCTHRKRPTKGIIRQRKVCHSHGKSEVSRPVSKHQREISNVENTCENHQAQIEKCYHKTKGISKCLCDSNCIKKIHESPAACSDMHIFDNCPVCLKYKCYFSGLCAEIDSETSINKRKENERFKCTEQLYGDHRCVCDLRKDSVSREPTSILRSRVEFDLQGKEQLCCKGKNCDISGCNCCYDHVRDEEKQGFYKNLERFYKRMYKQAKLRAQENNE